MDDRLLKQINHIFDLIKYKTPEELAPLIFHANNLQENHFSSDEYTDNEHEVYMKGIKRLKEFKKEYYDKHIANILDSSIKTRIDKINELIKNIDSLYQTEFTKQLAFYDLDMTFFIDKQQTYDYFSDEYFEYRKSFNKLVDWYRFKYGNIIVDNYCNHFCYYIKESYNLEDLEKDYNFSESLHEGGYFSPDGSTIIYYARQPYIRQIILAKQDDENKYYKWIKKFKEAGILLESFSHRF